jgi:hypothetical protein
MGTGVAQVTKIGFSENRLKKYQTIEKGVLAIMNIIATMKNVQMFDSCLLENWHQTLSFSL